MRDGLRNRGAANRRVSVVANEEEVSPHPVKKPSDEKADDEVASKDEASEEADNNNSEFSGAEEPTHATKFKAGIDYKATDLSENKKLLLNAAVTKAQSAWRKHRAFKEAARRRSIVSPIHLREWRPLSFNQLEGETDEGILVLHVKPYYQWEDQVVDTLDEWKYQLKTPFGTRAKKEKQAKKRSVKEESQSVRQMKDAPLRQKAKSCFKSVQSLQNMTRYKTEDLATACPASDPILLLRDNIVVRPKSNGIHQRDATHYGFLVPSNFDTKRKKELGKDLMEIGKVLNQDSPSAAAKRMHTFTDDVNVLHEAIYGAPQPKASKKSKKKKIKK